MNEKRHELDHEMARSLSYWLEGTSRSLHENPAGRDRLLDAVDHTPQRAHRWLPPISAGGLRTAFSTVQYATAVAIIALLGGFLLASMAPGPEVQAPLPAAMSPSPSAGEVASPGRISHVTGRVIQQWVDRTDQTFERVGEVHHRRDAVILRQSEWSDPRLPQQMRFRVNTDEYLMEGFAGDDLPFIGQGVATMEDAAGSWSGTGQILEYPGSVSHDEWYQLAGAGAYDGLSALLRNHNELDLERKAWVSTWEGFIVDGDLPPLPEPMTTPGS